MATMIRQEKNNISWQKVKDMVNQGKASEFRIGDEIRDTLLGNQEIVCVIAAINHYQKDELIFVIKDCICRSVFAKNKNDWCNSNLRWELNHQILERFPVELKNIISPRKYIQVNENISEDKDYLWLPSVVEYYGNSCKVWASIPEEDIKNIAADSQFPYYEIQKNRISGLVKCSKWTRTRACTRTSRTSDTSVIITINENGNSDFDSANWLLGVAPAFCIRKDEIPEKTDWFMKIAENLRDYSEGDIWSTGDEILCKTESAANALADMFENLYKVQGDNITICTGYYDPAEDEKNGETDRCTGWWYVNIE